MLNFTSFLKSNLICMIFWVACLITYENLQGNYFLRFFPTDAGDFTCLAGLLSLMWEILHACRESGRNSVQAGDSLSMRESWKPCVPSYWVFKYQKRQPCNSTKRMGPKKHGKWNQIAQQMTVVIE